MTKRASGAVYCDPLMQCLRHAGWKWSQSCHMFSDDLEALHAFAYRIGLRREWFQARERVPHYDLNPRRREVAVIAGVVELTRREAVEFWRTRWPRGLPALKPGECRAGRVEEM